jgi:hypothetical protein
MNKFLLFGLPTLSFELCPQNHHAFLAILRQPKAAKIFKRRFFEKKKMNHPPMSLICWAWIFS